MACPLSKMIGKRLLLHRWLAGWALLGALALGGCASGPQYTVDDGRAVNEALLSSIRDFGAGERALRPAIARSAALRDPNCDKQWELPFSLSSSKEWTPDERVAWVRALGVDERLTVVAASGDSPLAVGERIVAVGGLVRPDEPERLLQAITYARDRGLTFTVRTATGQTAEVVPFEVCRGYARLAPPNTPRLQDYHWLMSIHPLALTRIALTEDEALWVVLWSQGVSEEGGFRMKAYDFGTGLASTVFSLASLASGIKVAAVAADAAVKAAQSAAASAATELIKQQIIDQAKAYAVRRIREGLTEAGDSLARAQVISAMQKAAVNRGTLRGVARVAATVFDRADAWAFARAPALQANPLAAFTLHQKLVQADLTENGFILDIDRLSALTEVARQRGLGAQAISVLQGLAPDELERELSAMPLATAREGFSWEGAAAASEDPYSRGLIDAMLRTPAETPRGR
ncbi:MAG: hypothetical protein RI988_2939 [Pseudomonadota bacterium]|jgi:hypothetical protein